MKDYASKEFSHELKCIACGDEICGSEVKSRI